MKYDKLYSKTKGQAVEKTANLLHEVVVGLALNNLKGIVNNFMYSFGGFICSPPSDRDSFESLCDNRDNTNMRIIELTEYVPNIGSFADCLDKGILTDDDILKILIQIFYALYVAQQQFEIFLHADLHPGNILIVQLDKPKEIFLDGLNFTLKTIYIPIIIDYGFVIMKLNNQLLIPFLKYYMSLPEENIINKLCENYKKEYEESYYVRVLNINKENFDIARLLVRMGIEKYVPLIGTDCLDSIRKCKENIGKTVFHVSSQNAFPTYLFPSQSQLSSSPLISKLNVFSSSQNSLNHPLMFSP
jgi:hypothetical protein